MMRPGLMILAAAFALAGCRDDASTERPGAIVMSEDALGHYCQMALAEHPGPKAQVHLRDVAAPLFFAQVRDAIAYQRMPEQSHAIAAIYVSDMGQAESWEQPGSGNWIALEQAHFVVGSSAVGGMGAAELVPFSTVNDAESFAAGRGGHVVTLDAIADSDVLAPAASGGEEDYASRLRALSQKESDK
jgi:copper chaperone NosL